MIDQSEIYQDLRMRDALIDALQNGVAFRDAGTVKHGNGYVRLQVVVVTEGERARGLYNTLVGLTPDGKEEK